MATSGTYNFTVTRDQIIQAALRTLGAFGAQDTIPANDISNCAQALNIMAKTMITKGLPLWCVEEITVPCVIGQFTYNLNTYTTGGYRPGRVLDAFLRNTLVPTAPSDVSLSIESRYDYNMLGQKLSPGIPNQLYVDPQRDQTVVTLYNVPNLAGYELHAVVQRPIQDFNLATDNADMPAEAFRALKWNLADELALEYASPQINLQLVAQKAQMYMDELMAWEQEQASVFFTPNTTGSR